MEDIQKEVNDFALKNVLGKYEARFDAKGHIGSGE